jgi:hypothetical protein
MGICQHCSLPHSTRLSVQSVLLAWTGIGRDGCGMPSRERVDIRPTRTDLRACPCQGSLGLRRTLAALDAFAPGPLGGLLGRWVAA